MAPKGKVAEPSVVYKNGNLVRLLLRDFMTYQKVELKAGPNLNIVLGPNGTGKSALVCSIIIGLGGDPSNTGRSGHLGEYIRFGCDSALIEIELYNDRPNVKNHLIQRVIHARHSAGKTEYTSTFKLNEKDSNRTAIRDFVHKLNINVDNLCQFLPQEKVVEFVKMNKMELLGCTEKAAGDERMFEEHQQIVSMTKSVKKLNQIQSDLSKQISNETEQQVRAEEELRRIEERDRFKDEIKWLQRKRPWIEYEDKRVEYTSAKEAVITKKEELQRVTKSLEPLKKSVIEAQKVSQEYQTIKTNAFSELKKAAKSIEPIKSKIEDTFERLHESKVGFFDQMETENKRKHRLNQLESDLSALKEQFDNINEDNTDVDKEIEEVLKEMGSVNQNITKLSQTNMKLKEQNERLVLERNRCDAQKRSLEDVFRRRLDKLRELNVNAAKAYDWLKLNENKFSSRIYPPIMTQINVKNIEWSKYVESAIANNDLMAFMCEHSADLKLFTQLLKQELNIRVNVVLAPAQNETDFEPNFAISDYSRFGLISTVKDMFTAPNKIMAYLCKTAKLHQIPVGDQTTESRIKSLIESSEFKRIYTNRSLYIINVSRYDGAKVTSSDSVREARYLNLAVDENKLEELRQKISELNQQLTEVMEKSDEVKRKLDELKQNSDQLKNKKKLLDNKKYEKRILETKMSEKKEQITRTQSQAIDLDKIKAKTEEKVKKLEETQMNLLSDLRKSIAICVKTNNNKLKVVLNEQLIQKRVQTLQRKLSAASTQFEDLRNELRRLDASLKDLKREAQELRNRAKERSGFDINGCPEDVRQKFDSLPNTLDDIDNQTGTLRLRMNSILDADESIRDTYNKRKKDIEKRRKDLDSRNSELKEKLAKQEELKSRWLPALEDLIAKINTNFGNFMARLNCAGDVSLYKPDSEDCYDEYGISIKVKFRQTEQLRELSSFHQSGGERSVSTMIYMIALQELTHVPFRCVDEINQGMDENNERSVFDLISETSIRNNSQYFLFSPKLLTDLTYTEEMTIHVIFNGPYMEFDWNRISYVDSDEDEEEE